MKANLVAIKDCVVKAKTWNPVVEAKDETITYIDIAAVDKDLKKIVEPTLCLGAEAPSRARQLVQTNDVLVSTVRPNLNSVAVVTEEFSGATASTGYTVLRPLPEVLDTQYLFHWVKTGHFINEMIKLATGQSYPAVSDKIILNSKIPLPPLAEQRRIASILDQADVLRQKRQQAIEKLDQLLQATFIDMFGDPVSNPKGWEKVKFEDEVEFLTGFAFKSADFKDSGIKLCRGINVLPNTLDWNDTAYWNEKELEKYSRFKILQNDILVAMDRPWISTGFKITLVKENDPNMLLVQRVARLRVKESFGANFLFQILSMPEFKKHCRITETTVPHISPTDFKSFDLIKPDNHMIEKFEKIAKLINIQKDKMRDSEVQNDNLFASLQTQAFNGTL
ncbi:restriction endonuclease subunit S [Acinetobacter johnsonii]|uniref:restriction endonuclease subunit S n=1 Tax=Acinetobacter johnsonii TaxID=40214 RepID=UPI0024475F6D|nr:restriction endonuclease subunit S [Acinetobacter johnsonii]MDH1727483.1 restriction endonuclease subunit S [Acinetobacter johnsonii]